MKNRLLIGGIALILSACQPRSHVEHDIRPVRTQLANAMHPSAAHTYSGEVSAQHDIPLAFRVSGSIHQRLVETGQRVTAGQTLATLDAHDYQLEVHAKSAQLAAVRSELQQQEADIARYKTLQQRQFISTTEFERRQLQLTATHEKFKQAQADLQASQNRYAYTRLTAPQDGIISNIRAEPGQVVQAGQVIAQLANDKALEITVAVPENQRNQWQIHQQFTVRLWAIDRDYRAIVREISPQADLATRSYLARLRLVDADSQVKLGMSAQIMRPTSTQNERTHLRLPLTALLDEHNQHFVWILNPQKMTVHRQSVTVAHLGSGYVDIASGLAGNEEIVTAGVHLLREGQTVKRLATPAAGKPALAAPSPQGGAS